MKWMRFRVRTRAAAEDILIGSMQDIGLCGAQIEDHVPLSASEKEQMFVDIMPDEGTDDGSAAVSFYAEETPEGMLKTGDAVRSPEEVCSAIREEIEKLKTWSDEIGEGTVTVEETEDIDWINNWKQYFHQFYIDDILVIPSWEKPAPGGEKPALVFHIDPGTAFGTGMHETTQLCIRQIRGYLTPETELLDVGTGSGILSILSLMLGAQHAVGTDLDPCAEPAVRQNLASNGVDPSRFRFILGNLVSDPSVQETVGTGKYDIVAANILPPVLIPLTPAAAACLKKGGVYITSGIIDGYEDSVAEAMEKAGLEVVSRTRQGEWNCVVGRKN
ncbi:MAG: 50S ribosomal protein L11 methyltransferase [Lachnospiraceae bacterium]|jgi:ribosomal protein L11 methyltransferase|nr:50S ribosomal protein L11 methyltransferase [Lachnospiraceae bacterium]